jgi:hypothetical protein
METMVKHFEGYFSNNKIPKFNRSLIENFKLKFFNLKYF